MFQKMKSHLMLCVVCLAAVLKCTREVPLDSSTETARQGDDLNTSDNPEPLKERISTSAIDDNVEWGDAIYRKNHSRMLLKDSTTLGYDEWWFLSTRRPIISYKDFPGKPGVASWKEISPSSADTRKSRKIIASSAAGVSNGCIDILSPVHQLPSLFIIAVSFRLLSISLT